MMRNILNAKPGKKRFGDTGKDHFPSLEEVLFKIPRNERGSKRTGWMFDLDDAHSWRRMLRSEIHNGMADMSSDTMRETVLLYIM